MKRGPGPIDPRPGSWQGLLLAAHPSLRDPNFRRGVLFLSTHGTEAGAFGYMLNRPLGKNAAELLPEHDAQAVLERVPVYLGGPVGHDQLSFASWRPDAEDAQTKLQTNLSLEDIAEQLEKDPGSVRAFIGYAGWSAGQLEGEMKQKAWVLVKPDKGQADPEKHGRLWYGIMNSLGPAYKLLAAMPDDPSLN